MITDPTGSTLQRQIDENRTVEPEHRCAVDDYLDQMSEQVSGMQRQIDQMRRAHLQEVRS